MKTDALSEFKEFIADVLYQHLVSTDKSNELAIDFLKMRVKQRRMTYNEIRKLSRLYADFVTEALVASGSPNPGPKDKEKITRESIDKAWKKYDGELRG